MTKRECLIALATGLACLSTAADAHAAERCYELEEVNVPDGAGGELFTSWYGVNDRGEAVGNYCIDAFCAPVGPDDQVVGGAIYDIRRGTFETFTLPAPFNWVGSLKIANDGVIVGQALESEVSGGVLGAFVDFAPFVRDPDGTIEILPPPTDDTVQHLAEGVNPRGDVVGWFVESDGIPQGFVYRDGAYASYSVGDQPTLLNDVNARGDVVGFFADGDARVPFIAPAARRGRSGAMTTFAIPGTDVARARGNSSSGLVAGSAIFADGRKGFVYDGRDASIVTFPGSSDTLVSDVNGAGTIVGTYGGFSFGFVGHPVRCD